MPNRRYENCPAMGQVRFIGTIAARFGGCTSGQPRFLVVHHVAPGLSHFRRSSKDPRNILAPNIAKMKFTRIRDAVRLLDEFRF